MVQPVPPRLPPMVLRELEGVNWSWRRGGKHWRLMIDGRQAAVMNNFRGDITSSQNTRAAIRRFLRKE